MSEEVAILAEDIVSGNGDEIEAKKTLQVLKDYISRISSEMSKLDRVEEE